MKTLVIIILVAVGLYWLLDHYAPLPFNHEQFGLYSHSVHRIIGILFIISSGLVAWRWKPKKS
jgi:hypothetical protein